MQRRNDKLIVPVRDRRQHVRILTIKNFLLFTAVLVFGLFAINVISEMRAPKGHEYGRLFSSQAPDVDPPKPAPIVVKEAQVDDAERADPMLMAPMARAQYLGDPQLTPAVKAEAVPAPVVQPIASDHAHIEIVGGAGGVQIVRKDAAARPHLSGGFFRSNE